MSKRVVVHENKHGAIGKIIVLKGKVDLNNLVFLLGVIAEVFEELAEETWIVLFAFRS